MKKIVIIFALLSISKTANGAYAPLKKHVRSKHLHELFSLLQEEDLTFLEHLKILLANKTLDINVQNPLGETLLHQAVRLGYKEVAKFLVLTGANCNIQDKKGNTPLHAAFQPFGPQPQNLLASGLPLHSLDAGIAMEMLLHPNSKINPNIQNFAGHTPLHEAVRFPIVSIVEIQALLNAGARPDIKDKAGYTPMTYAASNHDLTIIQLLFNKVQDAANQRSSI